MATLPNSVPNNLKVNWHSSSVLHTSKDRETAYLFSQLLHSKVFGRCVAVNVSFADLTPTVRQNFEGEVQREKPVTAPLFSKLYRQPVDYFLLCEGAIAASS